MSIVTPRRPVKTFTTESVVAILDALHVPYKMEGIHQINVDVDGTGHYHVKMTPRRGLFLDTARGKGGTIAQLLRSIAQKKKLPSPFVQFAASLHPAKGGSNQAQPSMSVDDDGKKKTTRVKDIWHNGWGCTGRDEVYQGSDLDKTANVFKRGALRNRWHAIRDAAFSYFDRRKLDHRWMPQLRLFLLNLSEKDDYAMSKNGAVGGIAMPRFNNKQLVGLQRVYLDKNGKKITRMMLGGSGNMHLKPLDAGAQPLALIAALSKPLLLWGEGWETCAHSVQSSHLPCTVLYTAADIQKRAALYLEQSRSATPEQIAALPIMGLLVDKDVSNTGQNACVRAIQMLRKAGIAGLWLLPPDTVKGSDKSTDWADVAEELGHEAAGKALMLAANCQPEIPDAEENTTAMTINGTSPIPDLSGCPDNDEFDYSDDDGLQVDEDAILSIGRKPRRQNFRKVKNPDDYYELDKMPEIYTGEQGREVLKKTGIEQLVDAYVQWLADWRSARQSAAAAGGVLPPKIPEFRPFLVMPSCGSGKSTELKSLPNHEKIIKAGGAVRVFLWTKDEARGFVDANPIFFQYHGRSPDPKSPGYCANYEQMIMTVEAGHIPQAEFCFQCRNGLKWSVNHHGKTSKQGIKSLGKLSAMGIEGKELDELEACVWQDHQREALRHQAVATTYHSYSDNLGTWHKDAEAGDDIDGKTGDDETPTPPTPIPALCCFDEGVPFAETIEKITHQKVDEWAQRNAGNIRFFQYRLEKGELKEFERAEMQRGLESAEASQNGLVLLAQEFAKMTGKNGRISKDSPLWAAINDIINLDFTDGALLATWEKLDFDRESGDLVVAPLRAAYAIAQTLRYGDGHIENGALHVSGARPLIERLGRYPTAFFNATPSPADEAIIRAKKGIVVDVTVRQHVKITRRTNRYYGLKDLAMVGKDPKRAMRAMARYESLINYFPKRKFIIHQQAQKMIDPDGIDRRLGHWGADHRAQNRFKGDPLVLVGSFHIPQQVVRHEYQAQRLAALMSGAPADDWPLMQDFTPRFGPDGKERDDAFQYEDVWVYEGAGIEVKSFMPLPRQQKIREWYLRMSTLETIQAIGRARAVNAQENAPIEVDIFGGVPLFGLASYGLSIDGYQDDPDEVGQTHEEWAKSEQERTAQDLTRAAVQAVANGETITRAGLNAIVKKNRARDAAAEAEAEARKKQQETAKGGLFHLGSSIYPDVEQTPSSAETTVRPESYRKWLETVGLPVFADVMAVNGRAAAAVRASQIAMRDYHIDCDSLFADLEAWAQTVQDDRITADEAAEADRNSRDRFKRGASTFYRSLIRYARPTGLPDAVIRGYANRGYPEPANDESRYLDCMDKEMETHHCNDTLDPIV